MIVFKLFVFLSNGQTDRWTLVIVVLLLQLENNFNHNFSSRTCNPREVTKASPVTTAISRLFQNNETHAYFSANMSHPDIGYQDYEVRNYCLLVTMSGVQGCDREPPEPHPPWSTICPPQLLTKPLHFPSTCFIQTSPTGAFQKHVSIIDLFAELSIQNMIS